MGFDPLVTVEGKIRAMMSQYGDISEVVNMTDPNTGAFLGICSVAFRDRVASRSGDTRLVKAMDAARRAEKEGNGQRIDQTPVKIERDPEGLRCKRYVDKAVKEREDDLDKQIRMEQHTRPKPAPTLQSVPQAQAAAPPPNAPKGPSTKIPQGPRFPIPPIRPASHALVEQEPILDKIKRKPYVFIASCYVPVLGTTIKHLQNRLKMYDWREVRCDSTGYYITFDDSKRGEDETLRCYKECHMQPLFTYLMNMECQQYGNPNFVRSPTPERAAAEQAARDERRIIKHEDEEDFEAEKQERAKNLDPARAALERLAPMLRDIIISDIKSKIAGPSLFAFLDPNRHVERRKKLGLADPIGTETRPFALPRADDGPTSGTPSSQPGYTGGYRKSFNRFDRNRNRCDDTRPVNIFADERRRTIVPRHRPIQPLHRRLHDFIDSDDDSDDERRTTATRGSDGQDSRAISEVGRSPAHLDIDEDGHLTPLTKRRRMDVGWGAESDDETLDMIARKTLGHLIHKDPEDMATAELEQVLSTLPRSSRLHKRALTEAKLRRKALADDELFFGDDKDKKSRAMSTIDIMVEDTDSMGHATATPEPMEMVKTVKKKPAAKPKRKTKKQLLEEQAAAKAEAEAQLDHFIEQAEAEATPIYTGAEPTPVQEQRPEVEWGVSATIPRRTVEDDWSIILDVDGWQHLIKDDEDLRFLRLALKDYKPAYFGCDADYWAWNQKQIKALNNDGQIGIVREKIEIPGYYVPNPTGCARTEGYKKINQTEKSKYLPHRIKVNELRAERQAQAKKDPKAAAEQIMASKSPAANHSTGNVSSRSNRATNRRLVNDINTSKQALGIDADAVRFNQLKKRKKSVRFERSAIHGWGLYAHEDIGTQDMIIEYVGEKVRQRVADLREEVYQKQGIGSSYLFRIDEDTVIDATKKGGIARFINHSCMPNCTAKIIRVDGTKRIVIYALRDIKKGKGTPVCMNLYENAANLFGRGGTHVRLQVRA
jgi:[histone H3]-lysine4 N-trimethyltransferase SETD1